MPDFVPIPDNDKFKTEYIIEISKLNSYFKQNLAEIYIEENKLEEALKLLKQSLIINNYIYGENSVYTLCNNYKLYNLYSIKNDNQQKEKEYLEINNIKSKILGTKDLRIEQLREVCKI
ncbi:TPA: tetratricopeptide repeat protein [Candidatus Avigastranaerophilus faecigallinarum]|nr:tetratricopeptide repeat protein [Candidatus Avigastranaerophilus faecigallinarum]